MDELQRIPIPDRLFDTIASDISYDHYAAWDGINAHGLMEILKSPGAYKNGLSAVRSPPTPSMMTGILFEMALLEPDKYAKDVVVGTSRSAGAGQTAITAAQQSRILNMLAGVRANRHAMDALKDVQIQPVVLWRDPATHLPCKARLDAIAKFANGTTIAIDIKTARGAGPDEFSRAAAQFQYDLQAAHYLNAGHVTGKFDADTFIFIVVQNTAPYSCFVYEAGAKMLARGRAWREHAMGLYAQCRQANEWPGEPLFQTLELPKWAPWPDGHQPANDSEAASLQDGLADPPDLE